MSLTATVLAFASGLAAKLSEDKIDKDASRIKALEKRVRALECELVDAEAARMRAEVRFETLAFENARQRRWEERQAYAAAANRLHAQMAQAQQAQAMAQVNQQGFQQLGLVAQNLLGAQALQLPADWCTCIPDRASALRGR
jgi:hypothetical protein